MRINLDDCDVEPLTLGDLICQETAQNLDLNDSAIASICKETAPLFLDILSLAKVLGSILTAEYGASTSIPTSDSLYDCDRDFLLADMVSGREGRPFSTSDAESKVLIQHQNFVEILRQ